MSLPLNQLLRRQDQGDGDGWHPPVGSNWDAFPPGSSEAGGPKGDPFAGPDSSTIVRYVIVIVVVAFIFLWIIGGMWHANRRVRNGKQPLFYHRWLAPNKHSYRQRQQAWPHHGPVTDNTANGTYGPPEQGYPMHNWQHSEYAPPPPVYTNDAPPTYAPPPGPPPGHAQKEPEATVSAVAPATGESAPQGAAAPSQPPPAAHTPASHS